jgi:hypothetical protein
MISLLPVMAEPPAEPCRRAFPRPEPEPLRTDDRRTVLVGTVAWVVAGLALIPFADTLIDSGRGWWFLTCVAGVGLGLVGLEIVRRRHRLPPPIRPTEPGTTG